MTESVDTARGLIAMDGPFFALVIAPSALILSPAIVAGVWIHASARADALVTVALPHASNTEKLQLARFQATGRHMARAKLAGKILDRAEALIED